MAVFDVVTSVRKPSPFVLLQPRLRLQDIFPSTTHQHDYTNDEVAFVGLVPGSGSLYALSPDHFPLVAFGDPAPTQSVEGNEGVMVSSQHGVLQCVEGTTDRRCLTGVRTLRADSRSRLARLLDGVPGPVGSPPLASATGSPARPGNSNSQAYAANEQPLVVFEEGKIPVAQWEMLARGGQNQNSWVPSSSALLLALVSIVASFVWFKRKVSSRSPDAALRVAAESASDELASKIAAARKAASITQRELVDGATHIPPLESQSVKTRLSADTTSPKNSHVTPILLPPTTPESPTTTPVVLPGTPMPSSATDDDAKNSPATMESPEGAEDAGEVKKKRKRRRRRKGDAKDTVAEGGEELDNEDGEGAENGNAMPPPISSLVPPSTPAAPTSSLVVSDTVLGMFFYF